MEHKIYIQDFSIDNGSRMIVDVISSQEFGFIREDDRLDTFIIHFNVEILHKLCPQFVAYAMDVFGMDCFENNDDIDDVIDEIFDDEIVECNDENGDIITFEDNNTDTDLLFEEEEVCDAKEVKENEVQENNKVTWNAEKAEVLVKSDLQRLKQIVFKHVETENEQIFFVDNFSLEYTGEWDISFDEAEPLTIPYIKVGDFYWFDYYYLKFKCTR